MWAGDRGWREVGGCGKTTERDEWGNEHKKKINKWRIQNNPQLTVTGESTTCTFPSSMRISRALRQSLFTCSSDMGWQRVSCSICLDAPHRQMGGVNGPVHMAVGRTRIIKEFQCNGGAQKRHVKGKKKKHINQVFEAPDPVIQLSNR